MTEITRESNSVVLGIDLGTTNCALAFCSLASENKAKYEVLDVEQWVASGQIGAHKTLPSFVYLPHQGELSFEGVSLPWDVKDHSASENPQYILGLWARERGLSLPDRLISSAKSWLGHPIVDRLAPILPWRSELELGKLSPVSASTLYLRHLLSNFEHTKAKAGEAFDHSKAHVVLTVPASFDEVARNLTYEAAKNAGLKELSLLEEPLAAFYAWLGYQGDAWRDYVSPGDLILVCDVGGGTSDFSLIAVMEDEEGHLQLERVSVGDHLLLGGDNMDLALAFALRQQLENEGRTLDHWQFLSLVGQVRIAKEKILSDPIIDELSLAITGKGSGLFAQVISVPLTRALVQSVILDGFFPSATFQDRPVARRSVGIQEVGLPYENDAAITRHLAKFLNFSFEMLKTDPKKQALLRQTSLTPSSYNLLSPTAVLFNGGVFKSSLLRQRVLDVLKSWDKNSQLKELPAHDFDLAVALGAVYYGRMRATGEGIRVASGTARSYYVGLESPFPAVPGYVPPVKALCLVPQGTNEGTHLSLPDQKFGLVVGEPIEFRFFSSNIRAFDQLGSIVGDATRDLVESARLSLTLSTENHSAGEIVPVTLDARVTELGMLEIFMREIHSDRRWQVEFNVRAHDQK